MEYQATGKMQILRRLTGCWHPMLATTHGIPGPKSTQVGATGFSHGLLPGKVAGFPCSLSPCLLQPPRVVHVGGNPPIFTSASLDGRALGKRLPNLQQEIKETHRKRGQWGERAF